jgi:3-hydroxyacyl-[acyl-carrier-protein] dehydratase
MVPHQSGRGRKWLDPQLSFFADHFPDQPLTPAVLLIECAAQAAGALWGTIQGHDQPVRFSLVQIVQFKVLRPVQPGKTVKTDVTVEQSLGKLAQFNVMLTVEESEVARGRIILGMA